MASNIDPLEPQDGDTVTADTRANFSAAHDEIEALQTGKSDTSHLHTGVYEPSNANIQTHIANVTTNPHVVTKTNVGLGNVDNTSDAAKPISTATQTALDAKVTGPASAVGDNFASFNLTTGKIIKDSGSAAADFDVAGAAAAVQTNLDTHESLDNHHMSNDERSSMDAANAPTGLNPFITQDDFVSGGGHAIQDEGVPLSQRASLNFIGAGVVVTDNAGSNSSDVTISSGGGGEANTSSNSGAGDGWAQAKNAADLPFKSLTSDSSIVVTSNANDLNISAQAALDGKKDDFTENTGFNKNFGSGAGTVCEGDDSRLSDARTPTAHTHVKADITDFSDGDYATAAQGALADTALQDLTGAVTNDDSETGAVSVINMVSITQAAYDLLTPVATTLYIISG